MHWSQQKEQTSSYWSVKLLLFGVKYCPIFLLRLTAYPIAFFFSLLSPRAKTESKRFLQHVVPKPNVYRHCLSFSMYIIEKLQGWAGKTNLDKIIFQDDDIQCLIDQLEARKGAVLLCSHLGNAELLRALAVRNQTGVSHNVTVTVIVDFSGTEFFNRMLKELNPASMHSVLSVHDITPDSVIRLQDEIDAGGLVVIAGDRTSSGTSEKYVRQMFLGCEAPFPFGAFLLAFLLGAPLYFVFALRTQDFKFLSTHNMFVHKSKVSFDVSKKMRKEKICEAAVEYASLLESYCKRHPYQWYNFYDFWEKEEK
ncbi:MAG: hypothetical protein Ta2A_22800 [Treponemataceae bacterium]|nr:MAG: hypothetical protein Ta2A_22800 [Treponemataceae bacterium]